MYLHERVIHYAAYFLDRAEIQNVNHKEAAKELRALSNELLENLGQPKSVNIIRQKPKED